MLKSELMFIAYFYTHVFADEIVETYGALFFIEAPPHGQSKRFTPLLCHE